MDNMRNLTFVNGLLTFHCGVKVKIDEAKLKKIFDLFKMTKEFEQLVTCSKASIPKSKAATIKNHLT